MMADSDAPDAAPSGFLWDDELATLPRRPELIEDLLFVDTDAQIFGLWGSGKTFLALHLGGCLATGRPFGGKAIRQRALVVYVAAEGFAGFPLRWHAWRQQYGVEGRAGVLFYRHPVNLLDRDDVRVFVEQVQTMVPDGDYLVIIFDTKTRCTAGADESSNVDSSALMKSLATIRGAFAGRCTTLTLHHPGRTEQDRSRGHSSEDGALDTILRIQKPGRGLNTPVTLTVTKQKDGADDLMLTFNLASMSLLVDGEERLSAVIVDGDPIAVHPTRPALSRAALQALRALIDTPGSRASWTEWKRVSDLKEKTFEGIVPKLMSDEIGAIEKDAGSYVPTSAGRAYFGHHQPWTTLETTLSRVNQGSPPYPGYPEGPVGPQGSRVGPGSKNGADPVEASVEDDRCRNSDFDREPGCEG
jgi:hypothetical protein